MKFRILFRMAKFVAYNWSIPFLLGYVLALTSSTWVQIEVFKGFDAYMSELLRPLVTTCAQ